MALSQFRLKSECAASRLAPFIIVLSFSLSRSSWIHCACADCSYWGSVSHRGYSPWTGDTNYKPLDSLIPFGSIGQEIYGAGLAFEAALLAPVYGSETPATPADFSTTWQLTRRVVSMSAGEHVDVDIYPAVNPSTWLQGRVAVQQQATALKATLGFNQTTRRGYVSISVAASATGRVEAVLWLSPGGPGGPPMRPMRIVVNVTPAHMSLESSVFDVLRFGAKGDGRSDDAPAIQRAFDAAARFSSTGASATIMVPGGNGRVYLVKRGLQLRANHTTLIIDGRIVLPTFPKDWPTQSDPEGIQGVNTALLRVAGTTGVTVTGTGQLYGFGQNYWIRPGHPFPAQCHWWHTLALPASCAPALLVVNSSQDFTLDGLSLQHPPGGHIGLHGVRNAVLRNFSIHSPHNASDTDGIDTTQVDGLHIHNCSISAGDDNIAMKNDTVNVVVEDCLFGPVLRP